MWKLEVGKKWRMRKERLMGVMRRAERGVSLILVCRANAWFNVQGDEERWVDGRGRGEVCRMGSRRASW